MVRVGDSASFSVAVSVSSPTSLAYQENFDGDASPCAVANRATTKGLTMFFGATSGPVF
jgi:hypothetical protein